MGVPFDVDPTGFYGEPMKDITPGKKPEPSEFARPPQKPAAAAPPAVTEVDDFSTPAEPAKPAEASGASAESQQEPKKDDPAPAAVAGVEPVGVLLDEVSTDLPNQPQEPPVETTVTVPEQTQSAESEFEQWLSQMHLALADCRHVRSVTELRETVLPHLSATDSKAFEVACDTKQRALMAGTRKTAPAKGIR